MLDPLFQALADEMKAGLPFPDDHTEGHSRAAITQLLFGALMGLRQAKVLMDEAGDALSAEIKSEELLADMLAAPGTLPPWNVSPSLRAWSTGNFIGKSAANISAALDRSVNVWLSNELYGPSPIAIQKRDNIFHSYIVARIRCVEVMAPTHQHLLEPIRRHMGTDFIDTEKAYEEVREPTQLWPYPPAAQTCEAKSVSELEAMAVTLMWARHNAFKHQDHHYPRYAPSELTGEWSMGVLGLSAVIKVAAALRV